MSATNSDQTITAEELTAQHIKLYLQANNTLDMFDEKIDLLFILKPIIMKLIHGRPEAEPLDDE